MLHVGTFSATSPSLGLTRRINTHGKACQQGSCRCFTAAAAHAVSDVRSIIERQYCDYFLDRVDAPVRGDTHFSLSGASGKSLVELSTFYKETADGHEIAKAKSLSGNKAFIREDLRSYTWQS